jgi:hypothetical protein
VDNICAINHCKNGEYDQSESAVDCGGECEPCGAGLSCYNNDDCASGSCVDGVCEESYNETLEGEGANPVGVSFLIIGLVLMLGGGGYVIYITYFAKKAVKYAATPIIGAVARKPVVPPNIFQAKRFEQKIAQNAERRKSLLEGFDEGSEIHKIGGKNKEEIKASAAEVKPQEDFISLDDLKSKSSKGYAMTKLEEMVNPEKSNDKSADKTFEKSDKIDTEIDTEIDTDNQVKKSIPTETTSKSSEKEFSAVASLASTGKTSESKNDKSLSETDQLKEKLIKKSKTKKSAKESLKELKVQRRRKKEGQVFKQLRQVTNEDIGHKITELSGSTDSAEITEILKAEKVNSEDALKLFNNIDRDNLMSEQFTEILTGLIHNGKITKDTVSSFLFENIAKGKLSKRDAAKILSQLKLI